MKENVPSPSLSAPLACMPVVRKELKLGFPIHGPVLLLIILDLGGRWGYFGPISQMRKLRLRETCSVRGRG